LITLSGQVETMRESYSGLFTGMAVAVAFVYLLLVINFQSWLDPVIVLLAVPFALGGVMWILFPSQTHVSVPALVGTLMCIGLTAANSILVVVFANRRMAMSISPRRGRVHPTASGAHDGRRDDPRDDSDGVGRRRGWRTERPVGTRRHRRPAVRNRRNPGFRSDHVCSAATCSK
jgi:AcrB/AcrD/AcrF family protein